MSATTPLRLTPSEYSRLDALRRRTRCKRVWLRVTALFLLSGGQAVGRVAGALGVSRGTIFNWKKRWFKRQPLSDRPHPGARPRAGPEYQRLLVRIALEDPRRRGFVFARWTAPRLSEYLARKTGVRLSTKWVRVLLKRHGVVWRRTKRTTRNLQDPVAFRRAQRALWRLKRGVWSRTPRTSCGSETASDSISSRSPHRCTGAAAKPKRSPRQAKTSRWGSGEP